MKLNRTYLLIWLTLLTSSGMSIKSQAETHITTYVHRVQEERRSTRWTLTEWLRIKERMRLMDVWLAMFSKPKKSEFRPELNIAYLQEQNAYTLTRGDTEFAGTKKQSRAHGQLWLSNILSGTTGLHIINIDVGGEGVLELGDSSSKTTSQASSKSSGSSSVGASTKNVQTSSTPPVVGRTSTVNLRLFGDSSQDSALIFKYGSYTKNMDALATISNAVGDSESTSATFAGTAQGAELNLYLTHNIGAEANYMEYLKSTASGASSTATVENSFQGSYYDYMGFVEISLLKLMFGKFSRDASVVMDDQTYQLNEEGFVAGTKLQF